MLDIMGGAEENSGGLSLTGESAMQFLVTGKDGKDENALDRRLTARPAHLANAAKMKAEGTLLLGAALLGEQNKMIGSIMIMNMESREEVDRYLALEPYVSGNVWQKIYVQNISVAAHYFPESAGKAENVEK